MSPSVIIQFIIPLIVIFFIFSTLATTQKNAGKKLSNNLGEKPRTSLGPDRRMRVGQDNSSELLKSAEEHQREFTGGAPMQTTVKNPQKSYDRNYNYVPRVDKPEDFKNMKTQQELQRDTSMRSKQEEDAKRESRYAYDGSYSKNSPDARKFKSTTQLNLVKEVKFRRKSLVEGMGNEFIKYGDQFLTAGNEYLNYKPGGLYGSTIQFDLEKSVMMTATKAKTTEKK